MRLCHLAHLLPHLDPRFRQRLTEASRRLRCFQDRRSELSNPFACQAVYAKTVCTIEHPHERDLFGILQFLLLLHPRPHSGLDMVALLLQVAGTDAINVRHNRQDGHARHARLQQIQPHRDVLPHFDNVVVGSPQEDIHGPIEEEELVQMDVDVLPTDIFDFENQVAPGLVLGRPLLHVHAHRPRVFANGRGDVCLLVDEGVFDARLAALAAAHEKEGQ